MAAAVRDLQAEPLDVIVVVRGGGSKADLAAFDAEPVARAIATSDIPVWTGIGHTGDQSVADEVANRSFITPTECGQELARLAIDYLAAGRSTPGRSLARLARDQLAPGRAGRSTVAPAGDGHRCPVQLDRHADGLVHRARTLRSAARGQVDTHGRRLAARGGLLARSARAPLEAERATALAGRARRLAALPDPTSGGRGAPRRPVAPAARRLRLPAPARAGLLGDPGCLGPGGPFGVRARPRDRSSRTRLADGEVASTVADPTSGQDRSAARNTIDRRPTKGAVMATTRREKDSRARGPATAAVADLSYSDAGAELDAIIEEFETGVVDVDRLVDQLRAGHRHRRRARPPAAPDPDAGRGAGAPARGDRSDRRATRTRSSRSTSRTTIDGDEDGDVRPGLF